MKQMAIHKVLSVVAFALMLCALVPTLTVADQAQYIYDDLGRLSQVIDGSENDLTIMIKDSRPLFSLTSARRARQARQAGIRSNSPAGKTLLALVKRRIPGHMALRHFCLIVGNTDLFKGAMLQADKHCILIEDTAIERVGPLRVPLPVLGDFDGDGKSDLFVQSLSSLQFIGLYGHTPKRRHVNLDKEHTVTIASPKHKKKKEELSLGYGLDYTMGDINNDGRADILILAPLDKGGTVHAFLGRKKRTD